MRINGSIAEDMLGSTSSSLRDMDMKITAFIVLSTHLSYMEGKIHEES